MKRGLGSVAAIALVLTLAACGKKADKGGNEIDPAVANALEDQIMVDPNLVGQANRFGRTGSTGSEAPIPAPGTGGPAVQPGKLLHAPAPTTSTGTGSITLGERANDQAARTSQSSPACEKNFHYSASWATLLPPAFPLYPDAQVTEAAGNNDAPCRMRLVSFASKAPTQTLIDFYYTQAVRNGFTAEHQLADGEHILAGTREKDDGVYYLSFNARKGGGTDVDMIVNHGQ
jgi:predicted small lipoprotein YifL